MTSVYILRNSILAFYISPIELGQTVHCVDFDTKHVSYQCFANVKSLTEVHTFN